MKPNGSIMALLISSGSALLLTLPCAAQITVVNTADSGAGSLRQAIVDAAPGSTIDFAVTGTITLASELTIAKNLTISGPGASSMAISGNNSIRIFGVTSATVIISGLTLENGFTPTSGGCVSIGTATLVLNQMVIVGCAAYDGGGIFNYRSTLNITDSTISGNSSANDGGGINSSQGSATLTEVTITANSALMGGGVANRGNGTLVLDRCTVASNSAVSGGAGGGISTDGGELSFFNSTVSGNTADTGGGGLIDTGGFGSISITHCTIAGNQSAVGGGGLDLRTSLAQVTNTIFDSNTGGGGNSVFTSGSGVLVSAGFNLADDSPAGLTGPGDLTNANAALVALADNGGPTHTHALQSSSDAVDHIPVGTNGCQPGVSIDQRSYPRAGGNGSGGSACDVGAFEYQPIPVELMRFNID